METIHRPGIRWDPMNEYRLARIPFGVWVIAVSLALATATLTAQVEHLGPRFIRIQQEKAHEQMLAGSAGNPWQYRILADGLMEPLIVAARDRGITSAASQVFVSFRFLQIALILIAAGVYFRLLGLSAPSNVLGLSVLAWSMALSLYNSDLSFSVFFDVAFYLLAAIWILQGRSWWVALLMLPAALNRETSLLIPILLGVHGYFMREPGEARRSALAAAGVGLLIYAAVFTGLRQYYAPQPFLSADGYSPGMALLIVNLKRSSTWQQLLIVLGVMPLLAVFSYRRWPKALKLFFWVLVPVWVGVHFTASLVAEARLMLVPQALVFIPGALFGLTNPPASTSAPPTTD